MEEIWVDWIAVSLAWLMGYFFDDFWLWLEVHVFKTKFQWKCPHCPQGKSLAIIVTDEKSRDAIAKAHIEYNHPEKENIA